MGCCTRGERMEQSYAYVRGNAERILSELEDTARAAGVPVPTLVAVTKSATDAEVLALCETGLVGQVAENRVDRFLARRELLTESGYRPAFHLIGSLQTNKVKYVVGKTDLIQSLDSLHLAEALERRALALGIACVDCLVEVNSGREAAKGGVMPEETEAFVTRLAAYPHLRVRGLMTMGPAGAEASATHACFAAVRRLYDDLAGQGALGDAPVLSMGMSASYRIAAQEGANMVRVGRAFWEQEQEDTM